MISAIALVQPITSPEIAKIGLEAVLENEGVTAFEVNLQRVDVTGYYFSVSCEDTEDNLGVMRLLFGALNVKTNQLPLDSPLLAVHEVDTPFGRWPVAGREGRFAAEHPSPSWAK